MTKQFLIVLALILSSLHTSAQEKFKLSYIGFFQDHLENWPRLQFEIINLTNDTLYISTENIKFDVIRNSRKVLEEKIKLGGGQPFFRPKLAECPEKQNIKYKLAQKFAKKIVAKNNVPEEEQQNAIQNVEIVCLVIYPKEIIYTEKLFIHREFDRNYEVKLRNYNDDLFTSYESDSNKLVKIKQ